MISFTDDGVLRYRDEAGKLWQYPFTFQPPDGIATTFHEQQVLGLGAVLVLYAKEDRSSLFIQKAPREGYEFGRLWAFPGGMVRQRDFTSVCPESVAQSLAARVFAETGLAIDTGILEPFGTPVPTSYFAKGAERLVMVVPFQASRWKPSDQASLVKAADASVMTAGWKPIHSVWSDLAPANCCIAGQYFTPFLTDEERRTACRHIEKACTTCNALAESLRMHTGFNRVGNNDCAD